MKKMLTVLFAAFCGMAAFAVPQYVPDSVGLKGTGNTAVTHDPNFIDNALYFNNSAKVSVSLTQNLKGNNGWGNLTFGMYTLDRGTQAILDSWSVGGVGLGEQQTFGHTVNAEDTIGFWVSNGEKTLYSLNSVDKTRSAFTLKDGKLVLGFTTEGYFGSPSNLPNSDLLFEIAVKDAPAGQPLPGVLATLLIGGGLYAARRRKRD